MSTTKFKMDNPDYPLSTTNISVEMHPVSDSDIPAGNGGINSERYTFGELRHQPIIKEIVERITNKQIKEYAEKCNARNAQNGFTMYKVNGEYCFWALRVGPTVKIPTLQEMKCFLQEDPATAEALKAKEVSAQMIRNITYSLLRDEIASQCNMNYNEAKRAIGNMLDCAPHEDPCGYIFMVPNWAHYWFRHSGYVSRITAQLNS